ncbi:MAG: hypothetical protein R6V01_10750 [Thermoplasmatota archaeon]
MAIPVHGRGCFHRYITEMGGYAKTHHILKTAVFLIPPLEWIETDNVLMI